MNNELVLSNKLQTTFDALNTLKAESFLDRKYYISENLEEDRAYIAFYLNYVMNKASIEYNESEDVFECRFTTSQGSYSTIILDVLDLSEAFSNFSSNLFHKCRAKGNDYSMMVINSLCK